MKYLLSSIIVVLHFSMGWTQANLNVAVQIDSLFKEYTSKTPGVAIAVVKDGKTVFKKGYGLANLEYNIPIETTTPFHVASISKQFAAFATYLLQEQGKISLEDDINKYIAGLPDYGKTIKIKHLLAHTSGLKDQWALLTLAGWRMDDVITNNQILKLAQQQKALNFEPGSQFMYSNTGYTFLALIIESVTGKTFAEYTQKNIFEPLGMVNSQFYDNYKKVVENRAYSYEKSGDVYLKSKLNYATTGATSLFTTVEDLAKWVSNFHQPIVGTAEMIRKFNEVSYLDDGKPVIWAQLPNKTLYHAKGQLNYPYKGLEVFSHGGHDAGFRAVLTRYPAHQFAVITLSNNEHYTMTQKTFPLAELYLKDFLVEEVKTPPNPSSTHLDKKDFVNQLDLYEGVYVSKELGTQYKIALRNERLVMSHKRLDDMMLTETGKDEFSGINSFSFELEFIKNKDIVTGFKVSNFGAKNVIFQKIN